MIKFTLLIIYVYKSLNHFKAVLIPSIPGTYKGMENIKKFGHGRICKAVKELCGEREDDVQLEVQVRDFSSISYFISIRSLKQITKCKIFIKVIFNWES